MRLSPLLPSVSRPALLALLNLAAGSQSAWADGGIIALDSAAPLSQTRQEALLAFESNRTTYVVRTLYNGRASEFAWILPLPNTPTNVVAHADGRIFTALDESTRPSFISFSGGGTGCACAPGGGSAPVGETVLVEAQGKAGIFDWVALRSAGSDALLNWLSDNGFNVPAATQNVLAPYIQQGRHFLAVRVREPGSLGSAALTEVPPIQFSVETTERFYPMVISQISAADQTEVLLYVLAAHRAAAANLPNGTIDQSSVRLDPAAPSGTNYETLFAERISQLGGLALITEFSGSNQLTASDWLQAPAGLTSRSLILTRLRTLIPRNRMTQDFTFPDAATDAAVSSLISITGVAGASFASGPLAGLMLTGWVLGSWRRRVNRRCTE